MRARYVLDLSDPYSSFQAHRMGKNARGLTKGQQMFRLTIRATDEAVPPVLLKYMVEQLEQGAQDERSDLGVVRALDDSQ